MIPERELVTITLADGNTLQVGSILIRKVSDLILEGKSGDALKELLTGTLFGVAKCQGILMALRR